ncbi:MAG: hypothetical protein B7Z29_04130 [Hyphomicrobium sp. 12-62-95]|nr:MAG: hypothetical protein B7Z29_04130 [Hyphomicrobium sp. 12-62-95]
MRTTVLVRRQQRRVKIEAAKDAAVEGVKEAGRKGLAAGAAGAEVAGQAAVKIAKSAAEGAAAGADKGMAIFVRGAAAARSRIAEWSAPANARLAGPRVSLALATVAALAGAGAGIRVVQFGWDLDAVLLFCVALTSGLLWLWPRVFSNAAEAEDDWAIRTERVVAAVDRAGSWLPVGAMAAVGLAVVWFAGPVLSRWVNSAAPVTVDAPAAPDAKPAEDTVSGSARVAGPGELRIGGGIVRLDGLTLLDPDQTCQRDDGTTWACGAAAKQAFEKLVRRRTVTCVIGGAADGVRTGRCSSDGRDMGAELVRGGHGFADGLLWAAYSTDEQAASEQKSGLWAGTAERPEAWRARLYSEAAAVAPGGCPIKGRTSRGKKTYFLPHSAEYARTTIREDRGDRWFCSEDDAIAGGFSAR